MNITRRRRAIKGRLLTSSARQAQAHYRGRGADCEESLEMMFVYFAKTWGKEREGKSC